MPGELAPRKISREQLERIIQRAAELQAGEMDTADGITEQDVLKLGSEVGIPGGFSARRCTRRRPAARHSSTGSSGGG